MSNDFETSDYQLCVTLCALGFKLLFLDYSDPKRVIFHFENHHQIPQIIESFFRDEISINPRLVLLSAKLVKDRLHAHS